MFRKRPAPHTPEEIAAAKEKLKQTKFERSDFWALTVAALITIMPVVLLVVGLFVLIIWFIFLR